MCGLKNVHWRTKLPPSVILTKGEPGSSDFSALNEQVQRYEILEIIAGIEVTFLLRKVKNNRT